MDIVERIVKVGVIGYALLWRRKRILCDAAWVSWKQCTAWCLPTKEIVVGHSLRLLLQVHCSCIVFCADTLTVDTYNAALNKPAFQCSVWSQQHHNATANLANDGNLATNIAGPEGFQCALSDEQTYPWWAVDLGQPRQVYTVILTNRGDCCGTYFTSLATITLQTKSVYREWFSL